MSNLIINDEVAPFKVTPDAFSGSCRASKLPRDTDESEYISTTEMFDEEETTTSFNDTNEVVSDQGWYFMQMSDVLTNFYCTKKSLEFFWIFFTGEKYPKKKVLIFLVKMDKNI